MRVMPSVNCDLSQAKGGMWGILSLDLLNSLTAVTDEHIFKIEEKTVLKLVIISSF